MKLSITEKGFSLIEVVVSLFILSISVITIYNLIISRWIKFCVFLKDAFVWHIVNF